MAARVEAAGGTPVPAGEGSDDSARRPNTSGCRSLWPWLRSSPTLRTVLSCRRRRRWCSTTPYGDRSHPEQGLARSTSLWATRACWSRLGSLSCRLGCSGTTWRTQVTSAPSCRYSLFLCRRWWTQCWSSFDSWSFRLPSTQGLLVIVSFSGGSP